MLRRLRPMLSRLWRRLHKGPDERRAAKARMRFWAELREGEREAEADSHLLSLHAKGESS